MSFANNLKKIASEFNTGLRIFKRNIGLNSTRPGAVLDALKPRDVSLLMQPLSASPCENKTKIFFLSFPQTNVAIRKSIIEPDKSIKINFELPVRSAIDTVLDLPFYNKTEIQEPLAGKVIIKRAKHLIVIRRKKMKKHKYKKFLRKNKVKIAKRRLQAKIRKESNFQLLLSNIFKETETYCPEKYVNETLEKVNWKRPVTRVKGFLAPKWVIQQYEELKEERKIIGERIKECLK